MTTKHFKLALTDLSFFSFEIFDGKPTLDCPGRKFCTNCVFGPNSNDECILQDRDDFTSKQLAYLHTHHPEFFL